MQQFTPSLPAIQFATFLSPVLYKTYEYIADYVGKQVDSPVTLRTGQSLEEFAYGKADVGFLCGLQYVHMKNQHACPVELLVAPVLEGQRYQHRPIYYSDIIVQQESHYKSFEELQGCTWAYNELASHSGYNLVSYSLLKRDKTPHYFGKTLATGSHMQSLQAVLDGKADASAIDSHLLDVLRQERPAIANRIRIIDSFGPSTIPPLVVATRLNEDSKHQMRRALLSIHEDLYAVEELHKGCIERFALVYDEDYNDIRAMLKQVQQASLQNMG
jgi:phosphonate transport system substrate-binding protein